MKIVNKTPHTVVYDPEILGQEKKIFLADGEPARLKTVSINSHIGDINTVVRNTIILNLPEEEKDVYFIVSKLVFDTGTRLGRNDLLVPENKKGSGGDAVSCRNFRQNNIF